MKKFLFLILLALLFFITGCAAFRRTFSRTPESMRRTPVKKSKPQPVHKPGSSGDLLFDTVFRNEKSSRKHTINSSALSPQEKALVESSFNGTPRSMDDDADIRRIREQNKKSRSRQHDDVFGTRNGSYF